MPRTIVDSALQRWEVYATTGAYGLPDPARIVFRCLSDPDVRARAVTIEGDKSAAEETVSVRSDDQLRKMLEEAPELS